MTLVGTGGEESIDFVRLVRLAVVAMLVFLPSRSLQATISDRLFSVGTARGYFRDVLLTSLTAMQDTERAAFIIGHEDGSMSCRLWPPTYLYHQEVFHGDLPPGTLAIIHTHPDRSPRPSVDDQVAADRLGIPIYVLTRHDVFKADPGQRLATEIVRGEWWVDGLHTSCEPSQRIR